MNMKKFLISLIFIGLLMMAAGKMILFFYPDKSDVCSIQEDNIFDNSKYETLTKECDDIEKIEIETGVFHIEVNSDKHVRKAEVEIYTLKDSIDEFEYKNERLIIKQSQWKNKLNITKPQNKIIITLPSGKDLKEIKIINGVGEVSFKDIESEKIYVETGTSSFTADNVNSEELKIQTGTGKVEVTNSEVKKLYAETGTGSVLYNGDIDKEANIKTGTGSVNLELDEDEYEYDYKITTGTGKININTNTFKKEYKMDNDADVELKIETGTGKVVINTK